MTALVIDEKTSSAVVSQLSDDAQQSTAKIFELLPLLIP